MSATLDQVLAAADRFTCGASNYETEVVGPDGVSVMLICVHHHPTHGPFFHVLLLRDSNGLWGFPIGPVGENEDPEHGARRVVLEQIGYVLDGDLVSCGDGAFYAEVATEFEPALEPIEPDNEAADDGCARSFWCSPDFAMTCSPSILAPGVLDAFRSLPPSMRK